MMSDVMGGAIKALVRLSPVQSGPTGLSALQGGAKPCVKTFGADIMASQHALAWTVV